jgi:hypothetical protein
MKPYPPGLTDADVRLEMRRALFYSMCDVIEATCGKDPERIARFKRQKAALERRFGYKGDAIGS